RLENGLDGGKQSPLPVLRRDAGQLGMFQCVKAQDVRNSLIGVIEQCLQPSFNGLSDAVTCIITVDSPCPSEQVRNRVIGNAVRVVVCLSLEPVEGTGFLLLSVFLDQPALAGASLATHEDGRECSVSHEFVRVPEVTQLTGSPDECR